MEDVTLGEESLPPDAQFIKPWQMENSRAEAWPPRVCLKYVRGDQTGCMNVVMATSLESLETAGFSGRCAAGEQGCTRTGADERCCRLYRGGASRGLRVEVGGLLGVRSVTF